MSRGVIYIARNDELNPENHFKVGLSGYAEPEERMKSLSQETTNYVGKVVCKGYVLVEEVENCERQIHASLEEHRFQGSEYFDFTLYEIVKTIRNTVGDMIIEDWLEDPNERYINMEYYDIPKNYTLPRMQFEELVDDLPNLDFRSAAKFIHTNYYPTWISMGIPDADTLRVFYLLANKNNGEEYNNLMSVPVMRIHHLHANADDGSYMSTKEEINLLGEIQNIEMRDFFLLANGQREPFDGTQGDFPIAMGNSYMSNVANLLMIIGLALHICNRESLAQRRIFSRELADKFKSYLWRASDEKKAQLDRVEFFTTWDLDSIIEPMFREHLR